MIDFDKKVQTVLAEYHERLKAEDLLMKTLPREEGMKKRDEFLLAVGLDAASFLNSLIKSANAQMILEIGTSYGYSTIWLAEAARATGGKVITLEIDEQKAAYAQVKIQEAGLESFVDFRIGDALQLISDFEISDVGEGEYRHLKSNIRNLKSEIRNLKSEIQFDFVLVDVWKELYVPSFELFFPKLKPGAYVIADNMLHPPIHRKEAEAYRKVVKATGAFDSVLLPIGSGLEVSLFRSLETSQD